MRPYFSECLGTAFLLLAVVGSGIMGEDLAAGNTAVALLANAIATGCALYVLITVLGPVSGAHFNPAVTLAFALRRDIAGPMALGYVAAQIVGAVLGVWLAHVMFDLPILQQSSTSRTGMAQWVSETVATFGLLFAIFGGLKARPDAIPGLVAFYITGAYWCTSSTSFANPAVTIARALTDTFAGISPTHVPVFIAAQVIGVAIAALILPVIFTARNADRHP